MTKAVVLCGGRSSRFGSMTTDMPKTMLPVADVPLIDHVVDWLASYGIRDFVFLLGVKSEVLKEHLESLAKRLDLHFEYSTEETPLESAGALKNAWHLLQNETDFYFTNGDNITDIDIRRLELTGNEVMTMATVGLRSQYGVVEVDGRKVTGFREKPILDGIPMSPGIYHFRNTIILFLPETEQGSLEREVFPRLAKDGRIGRVHFEFPEWSWRSVKSPKELEEADKAVRERQARAVADPVLRGTARSGTPSPAKVRK